MKTVMKIWISYKATNSLSR